MDISYNEQFTVALNDCSNLVYCGYTISLNSNVRNTINRLTIISPKGYSKDVGDFKEAITAILEHLEYGEENNE